MKTNFEWGDTVIDSRDIIARHDELMDEYTFLIDTLKDLELELSQLVKVNGDPSDINKLESACAVASEELNDYDEEELKILQEVVDECDGRSDWSRGEQLIHESYFVNYIKNQIEECYEVPKELTSGKWPWSHMTIDYESAAEEALADYYEITVEGEIYYIQA